MSILRKAMAIGAALAMGALSIAARADEVSQQQEAIRAPLRAAYLKAKQAEKDAAAQRQQVLDRMTALLKSGNRELGELRKAHTELSNALVGKRDEQRRASQALSLALGRAAGNASDAAVKAAQDKLDAINAEVAALEKKIAAYEQLERDKIAIPSDNQLYTDLLRANAELDEKRQDVVRTLAEYMRVLRPQPPPYLQSVQVYVGGKAMYRAEWRVDDKAADAATQELTDRLDRAMRDASYMLHTMQEMRDDLRDERIRLLGPIIRHTLDINLAAIDIRFAGEMVVLVPAMIEAAGVVLEAVLTGGASTAERHVVEQGVNAGTAMAGALAKKKAGKILTAAEQALAAIVERREELSDATLTILQTALAKERADKLMDWRANNIIDRLGLRPGSSDAAKILVSDGAEQVIGRIAKSATAVLSYKTATALATATGQNLTKWQAVRSGAATFFTAKTPIDRIKDGFKGSAGGNVLGLCITAAKSVAAAYYGTKLGEAEERYTEALINYTFSYHGYYVLLQADRMLFDQMREVQDLYFQAFAYRLQSAGPRQLAVLANEGNNDPSETLTFALHFSQPIDTPPQARIAGLVIEMKPQGDRDSAGWAHWEGQLVARKLPDGLSDGVLEVSLAGGSKPYAALDANPRTAARFVMPDALDQRLPDRQEWSDYERGPDRNHRVAFRPPRVQQDVPWRGASTCDKINCDCGAVPVTTGLGGDLQRKICEGTEQTLRRDCAARKQTYATCPPASGPAAYPPPGR